MTHEIVYFDIPNRAEAIRILLHAAGIECKDTHFPFSDWPLIKATTPLGAVPVLKLDSESFCQSLAITRYAAKLADFYPSDPFKALVVDEAMDCISELFSKAPHDTDEAEKKKKREQYQAGFMTACAKLLEKRIHIYGNGGIGFAPAPSAADLVLFSAVKTIRIGLLDYVDPNFFDAFPGITATYEAIAKNDMVIKYYESRGAEH